MSLALFYLRSWGLFCCDVIVKEEALDDIVGEKKISRHNCGIKLFF
jgi:hypothetical protein